jgi:hypothetical protein
MSISQLNMSPAISTHVAYADIFDKSWIDVHALDDLFQQLHYDTINRRVFKASFSTLAEWCSYRERNNNIVGVLRRSVRSLDTDVSLKPEHMHDSVYILSIGLPPESCAANCLRRSDILIRHFRRAENEQVKSHI